MIALKAVLEKVRDAQKQTAGAAKEVDERTTEGTAQLAESLLRVAEVEGIAKFATKKRANEQRHADRSARPVGDALRRLTWH